jgi:hypothetical protein
LDYYLLLIAVIVSLALNVYIINVLIEARRQVAGAATTAAGAVGELQGAAIDYPVEIREAIPISLTIAYKDVIVVPISYTLPINTSVSVPLRTPLGTFPINVPVVTTIPINLTPTVPLNLAVPVSLTVPIAIDVPIHVELGDTPLGEGLADAQQYLLDLAEDLGEPIAILPVRPTPTPQ